MPLLTIRKCFRDQQDSIKSLTPLQPPLIVAIPEEPGCLFRAVFNKHAATYIVQGWKFEYREQKRRVGIDSGVPLPCPRFCKWGNGGTFFEAA